ncbi:MAG: hypothetical protein HQL35_10070 [Alphaproteobacteria bacterium]|nr:hypothetical protein [Alphaproteobacteria bacterium]
MTQDKNVVLVVHAVDTEGPLYESLDATFVRVRELHGITRLPQTRDTLERLRRGEVDLNGKEAAVQDMLNTHLLSYHEDWTQIDRMLERIMAPDFRNQLPDSFGGGWVFNWHCLDLVGFKANPRRRALGYHVVFDHYKDAMKWYPDCRDALHFHFHPMSTYQEAHRSATSIINSPELWQTVSRRIIEREWFPSAFRAGFHVERPDLHWFLEQWIPFDFSNLAVENTADLEKSRDTKNGRGGDWRQAPTDWSIYQPSHDNYQVPGNCRRWIARAQNVMNRYAAIDQHEVDKAFSRAQQGKPTIMTVTTHDFRDMGAEVDHVRTLIADASARFPDVKFKYCEGVEAFRMALGYDAAEDQGLELEVILNPSPENDLPNMTIRTVKGEVFGPQPWLAIETMGKRFIHDNLDFGLSGDEWYYVFHDSTLPLHDVRRIGIGANDKWGNSFAKVIDVRELL